MIFGNLFKAANMVISELSVHLPMNHHFNCRPARNVRPRPQPVSVNRTRITSSASMAIIYRLVDEKLEFLVFTYESRGKKSLRSVTGTQEHPCDSPQKTLLDELSEELFDRGRFDHEFYKDPVVYACLKDDENNSIGYHAMIGFLLQIRYGELRTEVYVDDTGRDREIHGVPQWIEADALVEMMRTDPNTRRVHREAIECATQKLVRDDRFLAARYGHVVAHLPSYVIPPLVEAYLEKFA